MDSSVGNFYLHIKRGNFSALALITGMKAWQLPGCEPDSAWPQMPSQSRGACQTSGQGARHYALGSAVSGWDKLGEFCFGGR
jgi:hypothetical protein